MLIIGLVFRLLEVLSQVVTASCMVILVFELNPWRRKEDAEQ